ncbi:MAG: type I DNA topoisomerase [Spirochaetaceae bacterium]|jgi:DNA topoisomerase-1|nr:type I DNA topoisomerase [Spirochaetaceae bacterium]
MVAEKTKKTKKTKSAGKAAQSAGRKVPVKKRTLVIVESPAKAATIEKYLGASYTVKASMGHLIDLPKSRMGVNTEHDFEPEYITVRGRAKLLKDLQVEAKKATAVLLASDNDREGEAIAYHLNNALQAKNEGLPIARIVFNEITPAAIKEAVAHPEEIDGAKVNAQKARRVLDRLVGYNLSPLLWKKVKNGLSAGRVQSCALKIICDREREVEVFVPEEYWTLGGEFAKTSAAKKGFAAELVAYQGKKPELKKEQDVNEVIETLKDASFVCADVRETEKSIKARPPFTTSQLQQTAANRLGFTSKKTMQIAQILYEGVNIGKGRVGLITYMRTDSVRISAQALDEAREWIGKEYPAELPDKPNVYSVGKTAQDAHEAIRPTYIKYTPESMQKHLSRDEFRLYSIIWERFVASQMKNAKTATLSADIAGGEAVFRVSGTRVVEQGFYKVLKMLASKEEKSTAFPAVKKGDALFAVRMKGQQHFTQGPARYTDASIIKTLEEKGIGRPSTYAPTISVLLDRYYVTRKEKQLVPTILGRKINDMLAEHFPDVVNAEFTAGLEEKLDAVEGKAVAWPQMIGDFYRPFKSRIDEVGKTLESYKGTLDEATDEVCEKCGKPMVKKLGKFGYFLACSGFPACRNAKSIPLAQCPKCGGDIVARKQKGRGKEFYGCANYPECDFLTHFKPLHGQNCPQCGWFLVEKHDKHRGTHKACVNPDCDYLHSAEE